MTEDEKYIEIPIKLGEGFTKVLLDFNRRINKIAESLAILNEQDERLIKLVCKLHNINLEEIKKEIQISTNNEEPK